MAYLSRKKINIRVEEGRTTDDYALLNFAQQFPTSRTSNNTFSKQNHTRQSTMPTINGEDVTKRTKFQIRPQYLTDFFNNWR